MLSSQVVVKLLLRNVWYVQNVDAIRSLTIELNETDFPSNLHYDGKAVREMGPIMF